MKDLAQTLEALDRAVSYLELAQKSVSCKFAGRDLADLQSLRDTLPQLVADAEAYRKMIAAGPAAWMDDSGNMWRDPGIHSGLQRLYAMPETKESGS